MKKVLFAALDLLSIAFLIGGYVIQYFAKRKLGMVRWLNFHERKVREAIQVDVLKYAAVIAVLILTVIIVRGFMKKRADLGRIDAVMITVLVILTVVYLGFTMFLTIEATPAYFLILPMIGAAVILQILRNAIAVWTCRNEK